MSLDHELLFTLANGLVLPGWLVLALAPGWRFGVDVLASVVLPGLLALLYVGLLVMVEPGEGGFGSLAAVRALFARDGALLGGWVHYLAFDLFVGAWEVRDARRRGVPHALVVPCLVFTFLLGPSGLLAWFLTRAGHARWGRAG